MNSSNTGNTDLVATLVAPGVYEFDFTMPADGICTYPMENIEGDCDVVEIEKASWGALKATFK